MHSTKPFWIGRGVGLWGLPLLLLVGIGCQKTPAHSPSLALPESLLVAYKIRLYPYLAGPRAARDSIASYRWEIAEKLNDTIYFGISRPARSLYKGQREGVVGRFVPADTGFAYYEELFWTYRFREDTLPIVMQSLLEHYKRGTWDTSAFLECCVAFPDAHTRYDPKTRRWVRHWPL